MHCDFIRYLSFDIRHSRRSAFSLVELLTVIFIIGLLIAILVPSLSAARNAAKKMTTSKELDSIKVGLEMFKNENGPEFPQTNGYPPSFAHPPIPGALTQEEARLGKFPFLESKPAVTGAHWLPAMLMGVDTLGYIKRSTVPNKDNLREKPYFWYQPKPPIEDPFADVRSTLSRGGPYVDVALPTKKTKDLPGRANTALFRDWDKIQDLPVVVDAFDQAILYYVANAHGRTSNMVANEHPPDNNYPGGPQEDGPPFYFHQDNMGFTGNGTSETERGWDFGNSGAKHTIALSGADQTAVDLRDPDNPNNRETFARYIIDRKLYRDFANHQSPPPPTTPLRPVNAEGYLLISAGVDGRYGTNDDVSNLPPWTE